MHALLLLLLVLVPAPKADSPKPHPFVGVYTFWWNGTEQCTHFEPDGTCMSPQYGRGLWSEHDGVIWFSEQGDQHQYQMSIDLATGEGVGYFVHREGGFGPPVLVLIRRGELLPAPRGIE